MTTTKITWQQMRDAGIDIERVDKTPECAAGASVGDQFIATTPTQHIYFGLDADQKGWSIGWYDIDDKLVEHFSSQDYHTSLSGLLADVARTMNS